MVLILEKLFILARFPEFQSKEVKECYRKRISKIYDNNAGIELAEHRLSLENPK